MLKTFDMAIPSKSILAPTIPYIVAFTSVHWKRSSEVEAGVGGGGGGRRWRRRRRRRWKVTMTGEKLASPLSRYTCKETAGGRGL